MTYADTLGRVQLLSLTSGVRIGELARPGRAMSSATQPDIHTDGAVCRLVLSMLAAFAEFERELIRERTREGMARVREQGTKSGIGIGKRGPDKRTRLRRGAASR